MITQELHEKIARLIAQKDMTLYDIELLKENETMVLRISLFKQNGVTLDDCEMISNLIAPLLDVELDSLESYHLEVSSPGIERVLKKPQHFLCSIGQKVAVTLLDKTILVGILESYDSQAITIIELPKHTKTKQQHKQQTPKKHILLSHEYKKVKTIFEWEDYTL